MLIGLRGNQWVIRRGQDRENARYLVGQTLTAVSGSYIAQWLWLLRPTVL